MNKFFVQSRSATLVLFIVPLFLYIFLIAFMPLMEPDESRYSDIPSLMNQTGDYVTPRLHHVVYLEKPPLAYWMTALIFKAAGESAFSARLFTALCAWGCIIVVYFMGKSLHDRKTGLYAAAILSTSLFHYLLGKINILDIPLTFFACLALWGGYRYFNGCGRKMWLYLVYVASAAAFLTKGLIGPVFPFAILALWLIIDGRWREIKRLVSPVGIAAFLAITLPWLVLVQQANKDFLWFFFVQEHFLRYTTKMHGRDQVFFYYVPVAIIGTLPWCAFLLKAMKEGNVRWRGIFSKSAYRFMLTWMAFIFLFYSISSSKLIPYIGPFFCPSRLFSDESSGLPMKGCREHDGNRRWARRLILAAPVILQSLLFMIVLGLPAFIKDLKLGQDLVIMNSQKWWLYAGVPIALQAALVFVPDIVRARWNKGWFVSIYLLSALFLGFLIFPISDFLTPYKSAEPVARAIKKWIPADRGNLPVRIALYMESIFDKIRTPIVEDFGELGFGIRQLCPGERAHYFLSAAQFYGLCKPEGKRLLHHTVQGTPGGVEKRITEF